MKIFSIYDTKSKLYSRPFYSVEDADAVRSASRAVNDPASDFFHFPEDFVLFKLGAFDDVSGVITPCVPESFGSLVLLKK